MKTIVCKVGNGNFTVGKTYKVDSQYDNIIVVEDDTFAKTMMMHHLKTDGDYFKKHFGGQ